MVVDLPEVKSAHVSPRLILTCSSSARNAARSTGNGQATTTVTASEQQAIQLSGTQRCHHHRKKAAPKTGRERKSTLRKSEEKHARSLKRVGKYTAQLVADCAASLHTHESLQAVKLEHKSKNTKTAASPEANGDNSGKTRKHGVEWRLKRQGVKAGRHRGQVGYLPLSVHFRLVCLGGR